MNPLEQNIRAAVQALLDQAGDGWDAAQIVVCMGLERITAAGDIESTPCVWAPSGQADWMTDGLIETAITIRTCADQEEDD